MSSYNRNISRLKETSRTNLAFANAERTASAQRRGDAYINQARDVANKLSGFSKQLYNWKLEDIKKQEAEGKLKVAEFEAEAAEQGILKGELGKVKESKEFWEFAGEVEKAKEMEIKYQELKAKVLDRGGVDAYPEADRIAKLSPHQQVGYMKEKMRLFNVSYHDKLKYSMSNSTQPIKIAGITYTSAQLRENNVTSLPLKEAALRVHAKNIQKAAGLERFSPEALSLFGVHDSMAKAHDSEMNNYRSRFNIESSHNTRVKANQQFDSIPVENRSGRDLYSLILSHTNTVDKNNKLMDHGKALDSVFSHLVKEGIAKNNPNWLDTYAKLEMPPELCKALGKPVGTTYGQQWPGRFKAGGKSIKAGFVAEAEAEKKFLDSQSTAVSNEMRNEIREKGDISDERLKYYEDWSYRLGGKLDNNIKNYKTLSAREVDRDIELIESVMASQNGYIDHATLDQFNPKAALKFRDDATKHEKAVRETHRVDQQIKGALNESWTGAGLKTKEKKVVWEFALANASKDYERQFNQLIANGYTKDEAARLAMYGGLGEAVDKETGASLNLEGVVSHIKSNGAANKYTKYGTDQNNALADGHLRVQAADEAKKEMIRDKDAHINGVIGGDYGRKQLDAVKESIAKHGTWLGIQKAEEALKYYESVAIGKRGLFAYGLIDAQLKADGHPGLFPNRFETPDDSGTVQAVTTAVQPLKYSGSGSAYNTASDNILDMIQYYSGGGSVFNEPDNLAGWLQ